MRITLNIADDVLFAAKKLARREGRTTGQVLSDLARKTLTRSACERQPAEGPAPGGVLGFRPFPSRGGIVTNALIDRLRSGAGD
jgi:hypothetical protein